MPLPIYAKIKNRYCIGCFGQSGKILTDLKKARPLIEKELPGIEVYICCDDEKADFLNGEERVILRSQLTEKIKEIACFRELTMTVPALLDESKIPYDPELFQK